MVAWGWLQAGAGVCSGERGRVACGRRGAACRRRRCWLNERRAAGVWRWEGACNRSGATALLGPAVSLEWLLRPCLPRMPIPACKRRPDWPAGSAMPWVRLQPRRPDAQGQRGHAKVVQLSLRRPGRRPPARSHLPCIPAAFTLLLPSIWQHGCMPAPQQCLMAWGRRPAGHPARCRWPPSIQDVREAKHKTSCGIHVCAPVFLSPGAPTGNQMHALQHCC